ncbi:MAG: glycosyltransferase [Bacteroidetes bacterium]|jgi:glycosyltransferase involved in cell wall biosynthesis|nr:glycosyltransferase [Bacteroidota bacterium]
MSKDQPKVVVCLPCYNAELFIKRTLESLKNQTYSNFTVLLSDDKSTDQTVSLINSLVGTDERFHLIEQKQNLGWIDHVDFLLEQASGEGKYTFIMPHDDTIEMSYVAKLVEALENNPAAVLSFSDMNFNDREPSEIASYTALGEVKSRLKRLEKLLEREQLWWIAYRGMMRADLIQEIIPSQKNLLGNREYAADWFLLIRLAMFGEFVRVPEVLYTKYYHENNKSHSFKHTHLNHLSNLLTFFVMLFRSHIEWNEKLKLQIKIIQNSIKRLVLMTGVGNFLIKKK